MDVSDHRYVWLLKCRTIDRIPSTNVLFKFRTASILQNMIVLTDYLTLVWFAMFKKCCNNAKFRQYLYQKTRLCCEQNRCAKQIVEYLKSCVVKNWRLHLKASFKTKICHCILAIYVLLQHHLIVSNIQHSVSQLMIRAVLSILICVLKLAERNHNIWRPPDQSVTVSTRRA